VDFVHNALIKRKIKNHNQGKSMFHRKPFGHHRGIVSHQDTSPGSLLNFPIGAHCVISHIRGGRTFISRMATLGFTIGTEVTILQNYGHGAIIVSVRNTRIALGHGEARKIQVKEQTT